MRVSRFATLLGAGAIMLTLAGFASQADARMQCKGTAQVIGDETVSTPFCEDEELASVARRTYAMSVTGDQMRNNPSIKTEVCLAIGHDVRVSHLCFGGGDGPVVGGGRGQAGSDMRLKRDIRQLATLPNGLRLYAFKYLWDDTAYVGVMAQDLLDDETLNAAVIVGPNGFYRVDYAMLGLKMMTLDAWHEQGVAAVMLKAPVQERSAHRATALE